MKLYHGSKNGNIKTIKKQQASAGEGVDVPKDELLEAIYLTPDYGFALACAARPDGVSHINESPKTIEFENPEAFNPDMEVYVYEIDVPDNEVRQIDELQYVVENKEEVEITEVFTHKAIDVAQYYELINWKREDKEGVSSQFKMR